MEMMKMLKSLLSKLSNMPILVAETNLDWFASSFNRAESEISKLETDMKMSVDSDFWDPRLSWIRPYVVKDGFLHIPIKGSLINHFPYAYGEWLTGYEYIRAAVERGLDDDNVKAIIFNVNSPGGYVDGCFELSDFIYESRGKKPIIAIADSHAYSAAYALASASDKIYVPRTGGVGSVGVICAHFDYSKLLDTAGIKVTLIYAGKHKADSSPYTPLPDDAKKRIQMRIDETYTLFTSTVSRNRGITEQVVKDTEAACLLAKEAKSIGFVDAVAYPKDALVLFSNDALEEDETVETEDDTMSTKTETAGDNKPPATAAAQAQEVAATTAATTATVSATDERTRIKSILCSEEAKGRESLAEHFAYDTEMSVDAAISALSKAPKAQADNQFEAAMKNGNPQISAEGSSESSEAATDDDVSTIMTAYSQVSGHVQTSK